MYHRHTRTKRRGKLPSLNTLGLFDDSDDGGDGAAAEQEEVREEDEHESLRALLHAPTPRPPQEIVAEVTKEEEDDDTFVLVDAVVDNKGQEVEDEAWSVIGDDDDNASQWTFADGQGSFLNAAVRGLNNDERALQRARPAPASSSSSSTATTTPTCNAKPAALTQEHFDAVDEQWTNKQRGNHRISLRSLGKKD